MGVLKALGASFTQASTVALSLVVHQPIITSATVACGIFTYYILKVVKVPELVVKPGCKWEFFLQKNIPSLNERYWCSLWCFEARFQTVLAPVLSYFDPPLKYVREIINLSDGGQLSLDWITNESYKCGNPTQKNILTFSTSTKTEEQRLSSNSNISLDSGCNSDGEFCDTKYSITRQPILIVLPGLTGSSESEYVKDFIRQGQRAGYKCVVFNNRGRGGVRLKTPRTYCAANCDDFAEAIEQIVVRYKDEKSLHKYINGHYEKNGGPLIVAVGISLGGMILGHYISDMSDVAAKYLTAAVGVSVPYNCKLGTESLEKPWLNLALNSHLAQCLVKSVIEFKYMLKDSKEWDYEYILKSRTIREFDSRFTALQFGFGNVNDYYKSASLHDKLHTVKVPYLGLSSQDDPFQPRTGLPLHIASTSHHLALAITSRGGHISFLEGLRGRCWAGKVTGEFLKAVHLNPAILQQIS